MNQSDIGKVEHIYPAGLHRNPAFSNVVAVTGPVKTIYIGGQNAVDSAGNIVGKGDITAQAEQIFKNIEIALTAAGANFEHIIKWNVYVVQGQPLYPAFQVFQRVWGHRPNPPVVTVISVAGLANPDFLAEIDLTAVVPITTAV